MSAVLIVAVVVGGLWTLRRRSRRTLAGLDSTKPTYSLTPPTRFTSSLKDHRR